MNAATAEREKRSDPGDCRFASTILREDTGSGAGAEAE
jgi:hypothetical protein